MINIPTKEYIIPSYIPPTNPQLKNEAPFQEVIPRTKKSEKSETAINTCVSLIKQHWKKLVEIPQKHDFLTWSIQIFLRKVKQFFRK